MNVVMIVIQILAAVLALMTLYLVARYNLHMFQLNGYKIKEHFHWLGKKWRKQALLFVLPAAGLWVSLQTKWWSVAVLLLCLVCELFYFRYLKSANSKKKLVFTKRVKRLIVTFIIVHILILTPIGIFAGCKYLYVTSCCMLCLEALLLMLVAAINTPIEKGISKHFINDAKRKIAGVPNLKIIGITGSYGKTSVKYYLNQLLSVKYNVLITPESFNTPMGVVRTIRESLKPTHEIFICEMGARHVGDIREICDIVHPQHGMITSIGPQHLETFFCMENISSTKFELADALPADGMLFLNGDNTWINDKSKDYPNAIFYRTETDGKGYAASDIVLSQNGTEFSVTAPNGETQRFSMRLIGAHNVINVLGAIAVANSFDIPLEKLKVPVRRIQSVEHRMQMREHGNVTIIDDAYNSNPIGSKAAVETLKMFDGVRIMITPGMVELGDKEEKYNYEFGTYAAKCCDYVLLVGKTHTQPIYNGLTKSGFDKDRLQVYEKLEDALSYAYAIREEGHKYILLENDLTDNY